MRPPSALPGGLGGLNPVRLADEFAAPWPSYLVNHISGRWREWD